MPSSNRQCLKYMSIANYLLSSKTALGAVLSAEKGVNDLVVEASAYKNRIAAQKKMKQAKKDPKPNKKKDEENYTEVKYKYNEDDFDYSENKSSTSNPISMTKDDAATTLGIPGCIKPNKEVLKAIYRYLSAKHHPDKGGNAENMTEINIAYEELK